MPYLGAVQKVNVVQEDDDVSDDTRGQAVSSGRLIVDGFMSLLVCRHSNTAIACPVSPLTLQDTGMVRAMVGLLQMSRNDSWPLTSEIGATGMKSKYCR